MDENKEHNESQKRVMSDAEVLSQMKRRIDRFTHFLTIQKITLLWRIIFGVILIINLIPAFFAFTIASVFLFPSPVGFYLLVFLDVMLRIAIVIFAITIGSIILYLVIQKPKGGTFDFFIRVIYIWVILHILPLVIFFMRLLYNSQ